MTIKQLQRICHKIAVEKGFWGRYAKLMKLYNGYWWKDRNKSEMLMLIVSELGEACEALRKDDIDNFKEEIADTVIRLADLCGGLDIDLEKEILKKIKKNKKRPYRHGKKF